MKIAIITRLFAKGNMNINACQIFNFNVFDTLKIVSLFKKMIFK